VSSVQRPLAARQGRFARTAMLCVWAFGWGSMVFKNLDDAVLAAPFFVLMTLATAALTVEVRGQARRPSSDGSGRWSGTDAGIFVALLGFAGVICGSLALRPFTAPEQSAGACFAMLFVALAAYFGWTRRKTLAET
jgi:hypothetical protein